MKNRNLCKVLKFLFLSKWFFIRLILSYLYVMLYIIVWIFFYSLMKCVFLFVLLVFDRVEKD